MIVHSPSHHPAETLLVQQAAGQLDLGHRVLIESHLSLCEECRGRVAELVEPGGRWLGEQTVSAPDPSLLAALEARLDDQGNADPLALLGAAMPLPAAARGELPPVLATTPRWRRVPLSSGRYTVLDYDRAARVSLLALRLDGGRRLPLHRHEGGEELVVLTGAFRDRSGHFAVGDYQTNPPGTEHGPRVDRGEVCWIVTRIEKNLRFLGVRGWLQRFAAGGM